MNLKTGQINQLQGADVEARMARSDWCNKSCQAKACEAELESLLQEEKKDRELIGFGTAEPSVLLMSHP